MGRWIASARDEGSRIANRVPVVRRTLDELIRVGLVDRAVVIAAQALFALMPLLVVLVVVLPGDVTKEVVTRFAAVTGLSSAGSDLVVAQVYPLTTAGGAQTQIGVVAAILIAVSATSFAGALMHTYERVWDVPLMTGLSGRRTALVWLLGWLVALECAAAAGWAVGRLEGWLGPVVATTLRAAVRVTLLSATWWWTLHMLLSGRVSWSRLLPPAVLSGVVVTAYVAGSQLVMPTKVASSVHQFGVFGMVLALATWLIGLACGLVLAAIAGRGLEEEILALRRRRGPAAG